MITISLKGNVLFAGIPGRPELELVPGLGDEFTLKQVKVANLRFKTDDKGNVTAMHGAFPARRRLRGETAGEIAAGSF